MARQLARFQSRVLHLRSVGHRSGWLGSRGWEANLDPLPPGWATWTSVDTGRGRYELRVYASDRTAPLTLIQRRAGNVENARFTGTGELSGILDIPESGWNFYIENPGEGVVVDVIFTPL